MKVNHRFGAKYRLHFRHHLHQSPPLFPSLNQRTLYFIRSILYFIFNLVSHTDLSLISGFFAPYFLTAIVMFPAIFIKFWINEEIFLSLWCNGTLVSYEYKQISKVNFSLLSDVMRLVAKDSSKFAVPLTHSNRITLLRPCCILLCLT